MFPLNFPRGVLRHAEAGETVLDPFAGRGTTLYAGRLLGLNAYGVDSNPLPRCLKCLARDSGCFVHNPINLVKRLDNNLYFIFSNRVLIEYIG